MTQEKLLKEILEYQSHHWAVLDLSHRGVTELPSEIKRLTTVTELDLSYNNLSQLPSEIGEMHNLRQLSVNGNQLTELPSEIADLSNLKVLYLANNRFFHFPQPILNLKGLAQLRLSGNMLKELPEELFDLTNLRGLSLGANSITNLSERFKNLRKLNALSIERNLLTSIPITTADFDDLVSWETFVHIIFYGNPLLPIPPEGFGMFEEDDFCDFGWRKYFIALEKVNHNLWEKSMYQAMQYLNSRKNHPLITETELLQGPVFKEENIDPYSDHGY